MVDAYGSRKSSMRVAAAGSTPISAVVDNASLAAVDIGPALSRDQQRFAMLGLLISGGIVIPGDVPNIVAASRLGITARDGQRTGVRTGMVLLISCFGVLGLLAAFSLQAIGPPAQR